MAPVAAPTPPTAETTHTAAIQTTESMNSPCTVSVHATPRIPREDDVEDHESGDQRCAAPVGDDAIGKSHERLACAHLLKHDVREQPQEAHPGDERA